MVGKQPSPPVLEMMITKIEPATHHLCGVHLPAPRFNTKPYMLCIKCVCILIFRITTITKP